MEAHILPAGTILDKGRYRIEHKIGQGGFGITYCAQKLSLQQRVAIKELYWRDHSARDIGENAQVRITREEDAAEFEVHKERFLREARILRDFSFLPGVVHIDEYFEENGTAYIVMEYVEGETLAQYMADRGKMPAREVFERFLPLIESLSRIHENGVIHRDISPDNIMVMRDESLKLIDFGAARDMSRKQSGHSVVIKPGYSPFEQYKESGVQGAWTDVYALCATMYFCITGKAPVDAQTRALAEIELECPSKMGIRIKPKVEAILMRGLETERKKRFEDTGKLARAIRSVLPKPIHKREVLLGFLAGLFCLVLAVGFLAYREYDRNNRFRNVVTETFYLTAPKELSAADFAKAQDTLAQRLDEFAGEDNYLLSVEGAKLRVQLPLESFAGQEIGGVISERFAQLAQGEAFAVNFQSHVNWEDPHASMTPGENQVAASELTGSTGVFVYTWHALNGNPLTPGERAHLIIDFKVRLDALGAPYAFGTMYGDENLLAFRMDPKHLNPFVLSSIGSYALHITAGDGGPGEYLSHHHAEKIALIEEEGQVVGVAYNPGPEYDPESAVAAAWRIAGSADPTLYLEEGGYAIASVPAQQVIETGRAEFRDFRLEGSDAQHAAMARYVEAVISRTTMPVGCWQAGSEMLDEQGNSLLREVTADDLGGKIVDKPSKTALLDEVRRYCEDTGRKAYMGDDGTIWIHLNLDVGPDLPQALESAMAEALGGYAFGDMLYNDDYVIFAAIDEQGSERLRIIAGGSWGGRWQFDREEYVQDLQLVCWGEGRMALLAEPVNTWWENFDPTQYGFEKYSW